MLKKKGFTLIELLVVIAIISLLVSILLPSLKRAKELANSVVCSTNFKQFGVTYRLYTGDYNNHIPTHDNLDGLHWMKCMEDYLSFDYESRRKSPALTCPTVGNQGDQQYEYRSDIVLSGLASVQFDNDYCSDTPLDWTVHARQAETICALEFWGDFNIISLYTHYTLLSVPNNPLWRDIYRHDGKMSVLYFDGHVDKCDYLDINSNPWVDKNNIPFRSCF